MTFQGFSENNSAHVQIPDQFFRQLLPEVDDLDELKFTLYIFWRLNKMEGPIHYTSIHELVEDTFFAKSFGADPDSWPEFLGECLQKAVRRGTLLQEGISDENAADKIICLNSPKGRALVDAIQRGEWRMTDHSYASVEDTGTAPNIFQLYEAHIGPLTPMIADALRDAEKTYPAGWVEDAFRIAVERNKRSWHYIEAILRNWQEGGRDDRKNQQDRRDTEEARRRYGEWEK